VPAGNKKDPRTGTVLIIVNSFCGVCKGVCVLLLGDMTPEQVAHRGQVDPNWRTNVFLKARKVGPVVCSGYITCLR